MNEQEFSQQYNVFYPNYLEDAFRVYLNAIANDNNFCIMGRMNQLDEIIGGTLHLQEDHDLNLLQIDNAGIANFYITDRDQTGNVLRAAVWNIGINDAWVLGGINGRSTFNFAGDAIDNLEEFIDTYLRSNAQHPITVTAREILGLWGADYEPVRGDDVLLFIPPENVERTGAFDFTEYNRIINDDPDHHLERISQYLAPAFGL